MRTTRSSERESKSDCTRRLGDPGTEGELGTRTTGDMRDKSRGRKRSEDARRKDGGGEG